MIFKNLFLKNWILLVVSNILGQVLGLFATIRIARALNPAGFGQFNLLQTTAGLGMVVAGLGIRQIVIRECARHPEQSLNLFFYSGIFRLFASIFTGVGLYIYSLIGHVGLTFDFNWVVICLMAGMLSWDLIESVAFGHEQMEYSAAINFIGSILWVMIAWVSPLKWVTTLNVSLAFTALQLLKSIVYWMVSVKKGVFQGRLDFGKIGEFSRHIIGDSMPFYWLALMTSATNQLPILFLAERSGEFEVALYNVGFRMINPLQMIVLTSLTALFPSLSRSGGGRNNNQFIETNRKALMGIVVMGTLGALVISLLRNEVVLLLFGSAYHSTADVMAYQCWYMVLYSIFNMIGTSLGANDRQNLLARLATAYSIIALPILWFGSAYGALGLAEATLFGSIFNMTYHWFFFQKSLPTPIRLQDTLQFVVVLTSGAVIAWLIPTIWPCSIRIALSIIFSLGFAYFYLLTSGRLSSVIKMFEKSWLWKIFLKTAEDNKTGYTH